MLTLSSNHLSSVYLSYLSICLLPITQLAINVSIESMNTHPTHPPPRTSAAVKVNCLGSLVGCLGVGAPALNGKINFVVDFLTSWEFSVEAGLGLAMHPHGFNWEQLRYSYLPLPPSPSLGL